MARIVVAVVSTLAALDFLVKLFLLLSFDDTRGGEIDGSLQLESGFRYTFSLRDAMSDEGSHHVSLPTRICFLEAFGYNFASNT